MSIIIYNPKDFNNIQSSTIYDDIDEQLKNNIKKLISSYSCFKNLKSFNNFYKKKNFSRGINKTDDKIILSYLNKITENNYNNLSFKIKSILEKIILK